MKSKANLLSQINTILSAAILLYVVHVEHRITALETQLNLIARLVLQDKQGNFIKPTIPPLKV